MAEEKNPANSDETKMQGAAADNETAAKEAAAKPEAATKNPVAKKGAKAKERTTGACCRSAGNSFPFK